MRASRHHLDLDKSLITIRRTVNVDENSEVQGKDTETHQQRRVVLDAETVAVLRNQRERARHRAAALGPLLRKAASVNTLTSASWCPWHGSRRGRRTRCTTRPPEVAGGLISVFTDATPRDDPGDSLDSPSTRS